MGGEVGGDVCFVSIMHGANLHHCRLPPNLPCSHCQHTFHPPLASHRSPADTRTPLSHPSLHPPQYVTSDSPNSLHHLYNCPHFPSLSPDLKPPPSCSSLTLTSTRHLTSYTSLISLLTHPSYVPSSHLTLSHPFSTPVSISHSPQPYLAAHRPPDLTSPHIPLFPLSPNPSLSLFPIHET